MDLRVLQHPGFFLDLWLTTLFSLRFLIQNMSDDNLSSLGSAPFVMQWSVKWNNQSNKSSQRREKLLKCDLIYLLWQFHSGFDRRWNLDHNVY